MIVAFADICIYIYLYLFIHIYSKQYNPDIKLLSTEYREKVSTSKGFPVALSVITALALRCFEKSWKHTYWLKKIANQQHNPMREQ